MRNRVENDKVVAVYSVTTTFGIGIIYADSDYVEYTYVYEGALDEIYKAKVYYDTKRPYFKSSNGWRIHLDECMRVN
jgi:hypothetical protein